MSGLRRICKLYGGMTVTIDGKTTEYVWDYEKDEPVKKSQFTHEQLVKSERKKYEKLIEQKKKEQAKKDQLPLF